MGSRTLSYYPALLDLRGRLVVLVGGGRVAARKAASLLACGARLRLVSPDICEEIKALLQEGELEHRARDFDPCDLEGAVLAVSATNDEAVNRLVADEACKRGIFVNVVDVPELCSFIVPAVVRRGPLVLAVSTSGASPAAARGVRQSLERNFGPEWGPYLSIMAAVRKRVLEMGRPSDENKRLFFRLAESPLLDKVAEKDLAGAEFIISRALGMDVSLADLGLTPEELIIEKEAEN